MTYEDRIQDLAKKRQGIVQTCDANDIGITKPTLYKYLKKLNFRKIGHGIFASPDTKPDPMYLLSLRSKQVVFSHDSALYLHNIISKQPENYTVTVKTGYNPSNLSQDGIKVFTIKSKLHKLGLSYIYTEANNKVPIYNIERTICDIIRSRNDIDIKVFQEALKAYAKRTDRNIKLLMDYARRLHVDKILVKYLEILL